MPVTKAQIKAKDKWNSKNYDDIKVRVPKGQREIIQAYAASHNISVNNLIVQYLKSIIPELNTDEE